MKRLIRNALNMPLFVVLGTVLFVMAGVIAFKNLSVEAFPDVTDTQVTVIALYPGRAAEEVEKQVSLPIEVALAGLPNSIRVFSHTQFGLSFTVVTYNDNADVNLARQQLGERLRGVDLPAGVEARITPNATPVGEIMRYRLRGDGKTTTELRTLEDWTVERALLQVPGVADVVAMGGYIKLYEVQPDLQKLRAYKLTLQDLQDAVGRGNANAGGSYMAQGAQQFTIRGIGDLCVGVSCDSATAIHLDGTPLLSTRLFETEYFDLERVEEGLDAVAPVADLGHLTHGLLALGVVGPVAGQPLRQQEVGRHRMKVALAHGNHALGKGGNHGAYDFWQAILVGLHQNATADVRNLCAGGADLEAVVFKVNVVRRLSFPDRQNHINRFGKDLVPVFIQDAQGFGIGRERTRTDPKNEAALGQVVEHGRLRGNQGGMRMREVGRARAQQDVLRAVNQRGHEQQTVGDVFRLVCEVFANEGIVKPELIRKDDGLAVFVQGFRGVTLQGVKRHGEVA